MTPGAWSKSLSTVQKQPPAKMATAVSAACALVIIMAPAMATPMASLFLFILDRLPERMFAKVS